MPLHDKPVSSYPYKVATPYSVVAWLKACAYDEIGKPDEANRQRRKCRILIELHEARLKHEQEERDRERQL